MTLALACLSIAFERRLLLLVLRVYEFAIETVHDRQFTELRPEEVDLFRLFFLMEEPPEAVLKEGSHHHLIVAFADIASVSLSHLFPSKLKDTAWSQVQGTFN